MDDHWLSATAVGGSIAPASITTDGQYMRGPFLADTICTYLYRERTTRRRGKRASSRRFASAFWPPTPGACLLTVEQVTHFAK